VALADPAASTESLRAACQPVLRLGEQQERLVNALLTLATGHSGLRHREPFDLAGVTARVVAGRQPDADQRGVRVAASLGPATVTGDLALAESLVANWWTTPCGTTCPTATSRSPPGHTAAVPACPSPTAAP
jgi:signal transduction histidine kinase